MDNQGMPGDTGQGGGGVTGDQPVVPPADQSTPPIPEPQPEQPVQPEPQPEMGGDQSQGGENPAGGAPAM